MHSTHEREVLRRNRRLSAKNSRFRRRTGEPEKALVALSNKSFRALLFRLPTSSPPRRERGMFCELSNRSRSWPLTACQHAP